MKEGLVYPKFDKVKGVNQYLGLKATMLTGREGRAGEQSRLEYFSGRQYLIWVVHQNFDKVKGFQ